MRFGGEGGVADILTMHVSLRPYPKIQFPIISFVPLATKEAIQKQEEEKKLTVEMLANQAYRSDSSMIAIDESLDSKIISTCAFFRE